jgi:4-alpha-glucanotransferase
MCRSAFAGNPLFICLETLQDQGHLTADDFAETPDFSEYFTDYPKVSSFKYSLLRKAFFNFSQSGSDNLFDDFCHKNEKWLDDYAMFMTFREVFDSRPWYEWPEFAARRSGNEYTKFKSNHNERIRYYKFIQFVFFSQWQKIYDYAHSKNISLIGDIPIYVAMDSADVWAHKNLFKISPETLQPIKIAGVPPDYFSETGQRWGNPVYRWKSAGNRNNRELHNWWLERFRQLFNIMDVVKIDHFRGFEAYWEIPANEETAVNGKWVKGPGKSLFASIEKKLNKVSIIAEDLGVITPPVEKMRDDLGYPGMKVLQFAFGSDEANLYLPHNYNQTNSVVYTGTHDNNTTLGWYMGDELDDETRIRIRKYLNCPDDNNIVFEFIRLAMSSVAGLAIIPMQDILGFGEDCRMNRPGTSEGNWRWRCSPYYLNDEVSQKLYNVTAFYNRLG